MFIHDKHIPHKIDEMVFHKDIMRKLCDMNTDNAIPHIILYGANGAGKKTLARMFLENIYGQNINLTSNIKYVVNGSGNTSTDVYIKQSSYHIVINPNNNNFDRYLIQNIVTEYARRIPIDIYKTSKTFKVVLINDVENLSYYAQMSLRRTMEKYSRTCRFFMICNSYSKLIDPLRSRCVCVRVPSPTYGEICQTLVDISYYEKHKLSHIDMIKIALRSKQNIKYAIWMLECVIKGIPLTNNFDLIISEIIELIMKKDLQYVPDIRTLLYSIMTINFNGSDIINSIMLNLCYKKCICDDDKVKIIELASKYEHNLSLGRREIIHLDGFIINIITLLSK